LAYLRLYVSTKPVFCVKKSTQSTVGGMASLPPPPPGCIV